MKQEWLMPGAVVPVDMETTAALVAELKRLKTEQEPVAWLVQYPNKHEFVWGERPQWIAGAIGIEPLYTAPRQWQGLTDEDVDEVERWVEFKEDGSGRIPNQKLIRYIERKLKEKNNAR